MPGTKPSYDWISQVRAVVSIRDAKVEDVGGILELYNYAVIETTAVWTEEPSDIATRQAWFRERTERGLPVLIAESAGRLAGFASFGDFRAWPGYRHTVENSVYVAPDLQGQGVGRALMQGLIDRGIALGKHVMVAGIESANIASLRLHASVGFQEVGRMPHVGTKFGRWLDLVLMQRFLIADRAP